MKCPACGHEITPADNFCPHCGVSLDKLTGDTTKITAVRESVALDELGEAAEAAVDGLAPGSAMLLVIRGNQVGERFLLDADVTTAGRHPRCDIFLDDVTVSRHHARFIRRDGFIWVHDENSLNGTYVNQALIDGDVALRRGDLVQVGKFRMVFFDAKQ
ncbi:MAG: zinc-ribbon and FHA domain-containing protein [Propionibacteriaceae bacterium]|jgi:hypothetical protein|nr:zinc-ribbon and FHA domain-containing protein [Propionibacteriaceae bacterium]